MKKLLPILLIFTGCAMRAQQSFPGVNITPNGGAAGKITFRTSGNVNENTLQSGTSAQGLLVVGLNGTVSMSTKSILPIGDNTSLVGSPSLRWASMSSKEFIAYDSSVSLTNACWVLTFAIGCGPSAFTPTVTLDRVAGTVTASALAGVGTRDICASNTGLITVTGCPGMTNPMTTQGDMIYMNSGVPTRLAVGAANTCLYSTGLSPLWSTPCGLDPAWTSYTPTVTSTSGSVTTTGVSAAYIQTGKTVKVRIVWTGSTSVATTGIQFTTPVNPGPVLVQAISIDHLISTDSYGVAGYVYGSINLIAAQPTGAGATFPGSTTESLVITGVYEAN